MTILCLGASGMLAMQLMHWVHQLNPKKSLFLSKKDCDITCEETVTHAILTAEPTVVINCAAFTNVDHAESVSELADSINGYALRAIVDACNRCDATLVHVSTDYVFDGTATVPYTEMDVPNPINAYGASKLIGENIILKSCQKYYILRVQWLFGDGPNFIQTMLRLGKTNDVVRVVNDQFGTPTSTTSVSKAMINIVHHMPEYGIYHFRNLNHCSWYEYAQFIFQSEELSVHVDPVSSSAYSTLAHRPRYSVLNTSKWLYANLYTPKTWQADVLAYLSSIPIGSN